MPLVLFREYFEAITAIEAGDVNAISSFCIPSHQKKRPAQNFIKKSPRLLTLKLSIRTRQRVTMESIVKSLGGRRIPPRGK